MCSREFQHVQFSPTSENFKLWESQMVGQGVYVLRQVCININIRSLASGCPTNSARIQIPEDAKIQVL